MAPRKKKRQGNTAIPVASNPTQLKTQSLDFDYECEADETQKINLSEKNDDGVGGSSFVPGLKKKRGRKSEKEKEEMKKKMLEDRLLEKKDYEDDNQGENGGTGGSPSVQVGVKKKRGRKSNKDKAMEHKKMSEGNLLEKKDAVDENHGENGVVSEQRCCIISKVLKKDDDQFEMPADSSKSHIQKECYGLGARNNKIKKEEEKPKINERDNKVT